MIIFHTVWIQDTLSTYFLLASTCCQQQG